MNPMRYLPAALLMALISIHAGAAPPLDIGSRLEPFIDQYLVETMANTTLRLQTPQPQELVIAFDKPWEGPYCGYVSIFKDDDRYRMYYRGKKDALADGVGEVTCYAESSDGIQWTKPALGIHEYEGATDNNIVLANAAPYSHNFIAFRDFRPDVPAAEKYKGMAGVMDTGLHTFTSPDGVNWTMNETAAITEGAFDSQNVAFWSESEQQYCAYFRTWHQGGYKGFRSVSRSTSKDFITWTQPEAMDFGHTTREHLYTNQTQPYFRAPHIYLSLAARFMPGRRVATPEEATALGVNPIYAGDCSDNVLLSSRGGTTYDRTFMDGFLKPEIGLENWTSRSNYPAWGIVPTGDTEISCYVQKYYGQERTALRRYTLRSDGFAAVEAPYAGGEMVTKTLTFTGTSLYLNYATSAAGSIRVQLLDGDGVAIPGFEAENSFEIVGNQIARAVMWNDSPDISSLAGTPVRIRFVMKDAELFAIQFR